MTSKLAEAVSLAALAHDGQVDKNGEPYVLHVLRVMLAQKDDTHRIVAMLHDVLEDTSWTVEGLFALGFSGDIVEAVVALTRKEGEAYSAYIDRVAGNELAACVKAADLRDNLRPCGAVSDAARVRYQNSLEVLRRAA